MFPVVLPLNGRLESSAMGAWVASSNCTPIPVAVPIDPSTEATPVVPDVELKVTATFTPDWQPRPSENGVFAATDPAPANIAGLTVARGIVWFAVAEVTEQLTVRTVVLLATDNEDTPLFSGYPEFRMPV